MAVAVSSDLPDELMAALSPDALKQVLLNLVQNAREAILQSPTPPDAKTARVDIVILKDHGEILIEVRDRGPGIPPANFARIFDPFFTTKDAMHGVGLGLFVAEGVVRTAGGRLSAGNREGGGAWFRMQLPIASAVGDAQPQPVTLQLTMTTHTQSRILVVDDDHAFRRTTAALLRNENHFVDAVEDGQQAVAALRAAQYDLMLLDLRMPGIDGLGVIEALRLWGNGIPILMISGFGTVDSAVRAMHLGADDFLTKPVEPDVLTARVADLLERRPASTNVAPHVAGMIGRAPEMLALFASLRKVAPTETTVLITGETGTGKERAGSCST